MNDKEIQEIIKIDEGFNQKVYLDTEGILTGGWGHTGPELKFVSQYFTLEFWKLKFDEDYKKAVDNYKKFIYNEKIDDLSSIRRAILIMMMYNMGLEGVNKFKKMIQYLKEKNYIMAGYEGLDSKWRTQVKARCHRLMAAMMTDVWI